MCNCKSKDFGENQVEVIAPDWSNKKTILIDKCILEEIIELWSVGVKTKHCCCGHNNLYIDANVIVDEEDINKMKDLGYENKFNIHQPNKKNYFYLKSVETKKYIK